MQTGDALLLIASSLSISVYSRWRLSFAVFALSALLGLGAREAAAQAPGAVAAANPDVLSTVKSALRAGSAKDLAHWFSPTIDLGVDGDKQSYSTTQAEFVVRDFFAKNPPTTFEFIHQGASDAAAPYAIGRYVAKTGSFRVLIKMKNQRGTMLIDNLDFARE